MVRAVDCVPWCKVKRARWLLSGRRWCVCVCGVVLVVLVVVVEVGKLSRAARQISRAQASRFLLDHHCQVSPQHQRETTRLLNLPQPCVFH